MQLTFQFDSVPIAEGDMLMVKVDDGSFKFINDADFETFCPPEGSIITTEAFFICLGAAMPSSSGTIFYEGGKPLFFLKGWHQTIARDRWNLMKLWSGDVIKVLKFP